MQHLGSVLLDVLFCALEDELTVLGILVPGGLQLLLPGRRPFLITLALLQQRLWHREDSSFHLHLRDIRRRCGTTASERRAKGVRWFPQTSIFAPIWGRPRRPNPNPNINGYSLVTVSMDIDGLNEASGENWKDIDSSDEAWGGNSPFNSFCINP